VNKHDVIAHIAAHTGVTKVSAAAALESLLAAITQALRKGDAITFVGFGTFKTTQRRARVAKNPRTGDAIKIPKRRVVRFTAGKALRSAVR
jgi:DNA-binding protein HU-beta